MLYGFTPQQIVPYTCNFTYKCIHIRSYFSIKALVNTNIISAFWLHYVSESLDTSETIRTDYGLNDRRFEFQQVQEILHSQLCPERHINRHRLLFKWYAGLFFGWKAAGA
jgi:hypothetical protein